MKLTVSFLVRSPVAEKMDDENNECLEEQLQDGEIETVVRSPEVRPDDSSQCLHDNVANSSDSDSIIDSLSISNEGSQFDCDEQLELPNDDIISGCEQDEEGLDTESSIDDDWAEASMEGFELNDELFEPIYENAKITLCGAYCAIMEFKRVCRLPFSSLAMLLQLLQMLCPPGNNLPRTVYAFKKIFCKASPSKETHCFCADCNVQFREGQKFCDNTACRKRESSKLIHFDITGAMKRVLLSKLKVVLLGTLGNID